jgi:RhtB (resistance to homoserine/threonine) family protein
VNHLGLTLLTISGVWLVAVMTPGPDFLVVTRTALLRGEQAARQAIAGVTLGVLIWGVAGYFGIHALFLAAPWLYLTFKMAGGAYLIYLGYRLIRQSFRNKMAADTREVSASVPRSAFWMGFITNLSNPKAALFTASLFAATLPPRPPLGLGLAAIALMVLIAAGWFMLMVRLLTIEPAAAFFHRGRKGIDRVAGGIFIILGVRLAWFAR